MFKDQLDLLGYVLAHHNQTLEDRDLRFRYNLGAGHLEFYQFGELIAIPIYSKAGRRLELLVLDAGQSPEQVDFAVKEMINMIKRKELGPVTRRIKLVN